MPASLDLAQVMAAVAFNDLITPGADPVQVFKNYARMIHPDAVPEPDRDKATEAFAHLQVMWDAYNGKNVKASGPLVISTKKRDYVVGKQVASGHFANLYSAYYTENGDSHRVLLKMPRAVADSDLMEREAKAIKLLDKGDPKYRMFTSELIETFRHRDSASGQVRRVNVLKPLEGFYTLAEVAAAYRQGVDPKHIAWMWRRLLVAAGQAHEAGLVHGAIVPDNVLIHPTMHGVVLVDWCYACDENQTIPAVHPIWRTWYPQSVFDKQPPTYALDLGFVAKTMVWLGGAQTPRQFKAFAQGCAVSNLPKAPELLAEFDELIGQMWGPRKYMAFAMPPK